MVQDIKGREIKKAPTPMDDSWWTSVLQDVEVFHDALPDDQLSNKKGRGTTSFVDWEYARELFDQDEVVELIVTGCNKGGLLVEADGLQGFVPLSHLVEINKSIRPEDTNILLAKYTDQTLRLKVIECDPTRGRVVLSERAALTNSGRRIEILKELKEGDVITGLVTTITDFGVFVDLGGVEGLVHISEISWGRVQNPREVISVGQSVEVLVLKLNRDRSRIALSIKRQETNPWDTVKQKYQPGQVTKAVITSIVSFGVFARLDEGVDGLIHISELSERGDNTWQMDTMYEGEKINVCILLIDSERQRLGLSLVKEEEINS